MLVHKRFHRLPRSDDVQLGLSRNRSSVRLRPSRLNGASGENLLAASSKFSVPFALTVKSICGSRAA